MCAGKRIKGQYKYVDYNCPRVKNYCAVCRRKPVERVFPTHSLHRWVCLGQCLDTPGQLDIKCPWCPHLLPPHRFDKKKRRNSLTSCHLEHALPVQADEIMVIVSKLKQISNSGKLVIVNFTYFTVYCDVYHLLQFGTRVLQRHSLNHHQNASSAFVNIFTCSFCK